MGAGDVPQLILSSRRRVQIPARVPEERVHGRNALEGCAGVCCCCVHLVLGCVVGVGREAHVCVSFTGWPTFVIPNAVMLTPPVPPFLIFWLQLSAWFVVIKNLAVLPAGQGTSLGRTNGDLVLPASGSCGAVGGL